MENKNIFAGRLEQQDEYKLYILNNFWIVGLINVFYNMDQIIQTKTISSNVLNSIFNDKDQVKLVANAIYRNDLVWGNDSYFLHSNTINKQYIYNPSTSKYEGVAWETVTSKIQTPDTLYFTPSQLYNRAVSDDYPSLYKNILSTSDYININIEYITLERNRSTKYFPRSEYNLYITIEINNTSTNSNDYVHISHILFSHKTSNDRVLGLFLGYLGENGILISYNTSIEISFSTQILI